ncbi:MAG: site-specific integrase [Bacteroidota bacterium]
MATTKLVIKEKKLNRDGRTTIYIQYCHLSKVTLISSGEKIKPEFWDKEKGKLKKSRNHPHLTTIDGIVRKKQAEIDEVARKLKFEDVEPTAEKVRERLLHDPNAAEEKGPTFFELIDEFIYNNRLSRSKGTLKGYRSTRTHLMAFEKKTKTELFFEDMNQDFYNRFCNYLFEEKGMSSNTVGRYIKTLKVFLNYGVEKGIPINPAFHKFKVYKEETDIVYLSEAEIQQLLALDLSQNERLRHVRDVFLFGCYTGLRYSDVCQVKAEHITDRGLVLQTQKTRDRLTIPLIPQARAILDRYTDRYQNALPVISSQRMNDYLKELCQLAGLDTSVSITRHFGSKKVEQTLPKYQLITTHTARRTFITLSLEKGIRPEVLMQITGHKDFKTLMRYVKIVDRVKEDEMMKAWGEKA